MAHLHSLKSGLLPVQGILLQISRVVGGSKPARSADLDTISRGLLTSSILNPPLRTPLLPHSELASKHLQ
jgi:hypothetical protein